MLSRKLLRKKANLQDCYRLYQAIEKLPQLAALLSRNQNSVVKNVFVEPLIDCIQVCSDYVCI